MPKKKSSLAFQKKTSDESVKKWQSELLSFLRTQFESSTLPRKKHARLMKAILSAIESGILRPGNQMPPEPDLAEGTGVSHGTVRRCLRLLADDGIISREHGRGTFVASQIETNRDIWHIRFLAEDGSLLPVYTRTLFRGSVGSNGPWANVLGKNDLGYVRVTRVNNVDSRFLCWSDFYVRADRFVGLLDTELEEINTKGMKSLLEDRFQAPMVRVTKSVQCLPCPEEVAEVMGMDAGTTAMRLQIIGFTFNNVPITYQVLWTPQTDVPLDMGSRPNLNDLKRGGE